MHRRLSNTEGLGDNACKGMFSIDKVQLDSAFVAVISYCVKSKKRVFISFVGDKIVCHQDGPLVANVDLRFEGQHAQSHLSNSTF